MKKSTASGLVLLAFVGSLASVACTTAAPISDDSDGEDGNAVTAKDKNLPGTFSTKAGAKASCKPGASAKESCTGGEDEDCDGLIDCADPDCSGVGSCPVCGAVDHPEAAPLALPDGNDGQGVPYESKLKFTGFAADQTLKTASDFVKVCVTMEHSWLRDIEIKLISPDKKELMLNDFRGHNGGEVHLGEPNIDDDADHPVAGKGSEYCWSANAAHAAMLDTPEAKSTDDDGTIDILEGHVVTLPAGDYKPIGTVDSLVGSTLDGEWTIRVTDKWSNDNGFIFGWSISFNPSLVADCTAPLTDPTVK